MKKVVIFGGSGFLGGYLVRELAKQGFLIKIASRYPEEAAYSKVSGNVGQITLCRCNLRNDASVRNAMLDADIVINLVGILYEKYSQKFSDIHAKAAEKIAIIAKDLGIKRVVHVSALGVDQGAESIYARTKITGERAIFASNPDAIIIRPSIIFGDGDSFFNKFACMAKFMPFLPLIGGGNTKFQPVYVGDVATVIASLCQNQNYAGKIIELGGPQVFSFKELLEITLKTVNLKRVLLNIPFSVASIIGLFGEFMPVPLLTRDQVALLKYDNIVDNNKEGVLHFSDFNLEPKSVAAVIPTYLSKS